MLGVAYLMVILDTAIVNVALPTIQADLEFAPENLQWIVTGYALTFGGLLLLGGRAGDLFRAPTDVHGRPRPLPPRSPCSAGSPSPRAC